MHVPSRIGHYWPAAPVADFKKHININTNICENPNFDLKMAEAPSLYAESLEKLNQELTCPICLKHFEEPKLLPCCHYYCRVCMVQMRARTKEKDYFQCPECRQEIRLSGDDLVR